MVGVSAHINDAHNFNKFKIALPWSKDEGWS